MEKFGKIKELMEQRKDFDNRPRGVTAIFPVDSDGQKGVQLSVNASAEELLALCAELIGKLAESVNRSPLEVAAHVAALSEQMK